jgi:two-component system CheB/CheR fusion protein
MAFVVVQHLASGHKGLLVDLLAQSTSLRVVSIADGETLKPGSVYVLAPDQQVRMEQGVLRLSEPEGPHGQHLPVDVLFRSLALELGEHAVGVVLSGMGQDGTLGLRAIKDRGGTAMVQDPLEARFDTMPRSAIDSGVADVVAAARDLGAHLLACLSESGSESLGADAPLASQAMQRVMEELHTRTGQDFSAYKKSTLWRRVDRRRGVLRLATLDDYVNHLRDNPQEVDMLFKEMLIGVTSFFRDPKVWQALKSEVFPGLLSALPRGGQLKAWLPGCSTGEEAYSLAMVFREVLDAMKPKVPVGLRIFATDLDKDAIDKARAGIFPAEIAGQMSAPRLGRFFTAEDGRYRANSEIRQMITFATQNLISDPPFTRLDLLSCRNVLIYLEPELQARILPLFHYSLKPGGVLVLGSSESTDAATDLFSTFKSKERIFKKNQVMSPGYVTSGLSFAWNSSESKRPLPLALRSGNDLRLLTEGLLLKGYCPAAVLSNEMGDVLYFHGKTSEYLEPPAGKANLNLFSMAREGLSGSLDLAFAQALRQRTAVTVRGLSTSGSRTFDVTVQPLANETAGVQGGAPATGEARPITLALVVFAAVSPSFPRGDGQDDEQDRSASGPDQSRELRSAMRELQALRQEAQASREELQSGNEELQSLNEELTTSKEEMQSMNEELQTVNHELVAKVEELSRASDDMLNLLNSTDIATLFLDEKLQVRRFTTRAASIFRLIPSDTGRPITDLASSLDYPGLVQEAGDVLSSLVVHERQAHALDGRLFKVRIMPYRTQDNRIDGVVLTFVDLGIADRQDQGRR